MGYYVGPVPDSDILALFHEYRERAASWAGDRANLNALSLQSSGLIRQGRPETLYGMRLVVDDTLPPGALELRDREGRVLGRVVNREIDPPTTGPTTRLVCWRCSDVLPPGACFCIECGAAL